MTTDREERLEMSNEQRIINRCNGRNMASEVASLLADDDFSNRDYMEAFVEELVKVAGLNDVKATEEKPEPIARLGATIMPFGAHKDKSLDDVPFEYLDWLCRSQEECYKNLRAYLKHPLLESRRCGEIGEPI
jgi:hypothetical protein